jgi:hypothetical protein
VVTHFEALSMDAISMRIAVWMFHGRAYAGGRFVSGIEMLPWVRLEARPFHIPTRIALVGCLLGFDVGCVDEFRVGEGRCVLPW